MDVKAERSNEADLFARISFGLLRRIQLSGKESKQNFVKIWDQKRLFGYFWVKQDTIPNSDEAIYLPDLPSHISTVRVQFMPDSALKDASRVVLCPFSTKDELLAIALADELSDFAVLSQARLVYEGCCLSIKVGTVTVNLKVIEYQPGHEEVVKLVRDTLLEIENAPTEEPKTTSSKPAPSLLSVISNSSVQPGLALFNFADMVDLGWRTVGDKVLLEIEPMQQARTLNNWEGRIGLVATPGPSRTVKKGTLHVHPKTISLRILNTAAVRYS